MELVHSVNPSHLEVTHKHTLGYCECTLLVYCISPLYIGPPHPPQLVAVTPVNSTTVAVSWSEVQCFNGSEAVTHYLVQYQSMCGGAVQNVTTNGLVQTVNISSLTPKSGYTFQVAAADVNGTGPFSEPITLGGSKFWSIVGYMV